MEWGIGFIGIFQNQNYPKTKHKNANHELEFRNVELYMLGEPGLLVQADFIPRSPGYKFYTNNP